MLNITTYYQKGHWFKINRQQIKDRKNSSSKLFLVFLTVFFIIFFLYLLLAVKITNAAELWQTDLITQSHTVINLKPQASLTYRLLFKNTGDIVWPSSGANKICLKYAGGNSSQFYHVSWVDKRTPVCLKSNLEISAETTFSFIIQAPKKYGLQVEYFVLAVGDDAVIAGSRIEIPVNVTDSPNANIPKAVVASTKTEKTTDLSVSQAKTENSAPTATQATNQLLNTKLTLTLNEPTDFRVGLYSTDKPVKIKANKNYYIIDGNGQTIDELGPNQIASVEFGGNNQYYLFTERNNRISLSYLRFVPKEQNTIFEITNYNNAPRWNSNLQDNLFRGSLIVRYAPATKKLWVINELPFNDYLKGIQETSNISPLEYQKSIAIAARSYALYHYLNPTKHASENYHLDAVYDQVYHGYASEIRLPNFVKAVEETRGQVVTYNNSLVYTPYFSQSDGRTRAWSEVWSGSDKPWLTSVPVPYDNNLEKWGHGVGMSAHGALVMASRENKNYSDILHYFYQNIEITKVF